MATSPLEATFASFREEYESLSHALQKSDLFQDPEQAATLSRQHRKLGNLLALYDEGQRLTKQIEENRELTSDPELGEMARQELPELEKRQQELDQQIEELLIPSDPDESKNVILEIRAGTGGDEAELFAAELFRSYSRYAEQRGWKV